MIEGIVFLAGGFFIWVVGGQRLVRRQSNKNYMKSHDPLYGELAKHSRNSLNSWSKRPSKDLQQISGGYSKDSFLFGKDFTERLNSMKVKAKTGNPQKIVSPFHGAGPNITPGWHSNFYGNESANPRPSDWVNRSRSY